MSIGIGGRLSASPRSSLASNPIAIDCARAAASLTKAAAEVVVFEHERAFVVASAQVEALQPRPMTAAETQLSVNGGQRHATVGADSAFAIVSEAGLAIGAISIHGDADLDHLDALHALARVVSSAATDATDDGRSLDAAVVQGLRDAVVVISSELRVLWANRALGLLVGRTPAEVVGLSAVDLVHPDDLATALDAVTRMRDGLEMYRVHLRLARADGGFEPVEVTGIDHTDDPTLGGLVLSLRNDDAAGERGAAADRDRHLADAIVGGLHDGIIATDRFGSVTRVNDVAQHLFGLVLGEAPATVDLSKLLLIDSHGRRRSVAECGGDPRQEYCVVNPASGRDVRYVTLRRQDVVDAQSDSLGQVYVVHDITEARKAAAELRSQALHDQLTGLPNRRQLISRLDRLDLDADMLVAACFIDLDGFKLVNDTHGHRTGDILVRVAAQRLLGRLGADDLLVRQGGDEFVALLLGVDDLDAAVARAELLRETLAVPYAISGERFDVTASIGVALSRVEGLSPDTLLQHADMALYEAKARGRNRVESFDSRLADAVNLEDRQRRMLREALDQDRLVMHFQPLIGTATGETRGYEALARIETEDGQTLGPASFLEAISATGLVWDLDRAAFDLSVEAAAVLAHLEPTDPPTVACNFSALSLSRRTLVEVLNETTRRHGVAPAQICIEITESAAFESGAAGREALETLRAAGYLIALDDFGTGYSSLVHLRDLPITSIKVDRTFVERLPHDSTERSITGAVVRLAAELGLGIIAEGVETSEQLAQVKRLGFDLVQGWHHAPALPLHDILTMMSATNTAG